MTFISLLQFRVRTEVQLKTQHSKLITDCGGNAMTSPAKIGVNRRHAERSAGPCMAEGRAGVAGNAIQRDPPPGTDRGHSPSYTGDAYAVKQSHGPVQGPPVVLSSVETQYLASLSPQTKTAVSTTEPTLLSCQTKPTEAGGSIGRGSGMAFAETQDIASLRRRDRQSQSDGPLSCAKQSQPPKMRSAE